MAENVTKKTAEEATSVAKEASEADDETELEHFDPEFDRDLSDTIVKLVQESWGCFFCEKRGATRTCSCCKVAVYCDRDCQRLDWRVGYNNNKHKESCGVFCDNRKAGESILLSMRSVGWLSEKEFMQASFKRRNVLLHSLASLKQELGISIQSSVIEILGTIRLVGSLSFFDVHTEEVRSIRDVLIHTVDEATPETKSRLYDGAGTISQEARARVIQEWLDFAKHMKVHKLSISSVTFGRGMMDFVDDADFQSLLEEHGFKNAITIPSSDYAFAGTMSSFANMFSQGFG